MAGLMSKVARFANSPQGRKAAEKAKQMANDPKNRKKIEDYRRKFAQRRAG